MCGAQADEYAEWYTALTLAARGKTMADSSYRDEVRSMKEVSLSVQYSPSLSLSPTRTGLGLCYVQLEHVCYPKNNLKNMLNNPIELVHY